jgi:hypothetical protein
MKTDQKSVFLERDGHLLPRLVIKILYIIFMGFPKYWDSPENSKMLGFDFIEKCLLTMKTCRKYVFHPHGAHIFARLDIMILHTIFLRF